MISFGSEKYEATRFQKSKKVTTVTYISNHQRCWEKTFSLSSDFFLNQVLEEIITEKVEL